MSDTALRAHDNHDNWVPYPKLEEEAYVVPSHDKRASYGWKIVSTRVPYLRVIRPALAPKAAKSAQLGLLLELRRLADVWKAETMFKSSAQEIVMHPAYQQIIGFGEPALPFIVDELRASDGEWFWALRMITRENPVRAEDQGDYLAMKNAWLEWADRRGI